MVRSALPEHLNEEHEIDENFKDDDESWFGKLRKKIKPWFAYGPRAKESWARWREVPKVLWAEKKGHYWRLEADGKPDKWCGHPDPRGCIKENEGYYLSRIQLWCESHKAIQWPLFFSYHKYKDPKDVIPVGTKEDRDGKIIMFYAGAKRDADGVTWFPALFGGANFK